MNELKRADICPNCNDENIQKHSQYQIKSGESRQLYYCENCEQHFSETQNTLLFGLHTPISRIILILDALTEGMGINAICRVFYVSKGSIYRWQERFSQLKETLLLYSLCHQFVHQIIEGDELYTKVKKTPNLVIQKVGLSF